MLIRWAQAEDKAAWTDLAQGVAEIFGAPDMPTSQSFNDYMTNKIARYEALLAADRMSNSCLGIIGFSRINNRVSWLGVFERHRGKGIGSRLLQTALRQLDTARDITVTTFRDDYPPGLPARALYKKFGFNDVELTIHDGQPRALMVRPSSNEKRGGSFHYHYPEFIRESQREFCPACNGCPSPAGQDEIAIIDDCYVMAEYPGQGHLFGKMYVMPIEHHFHFEDMPEPNMAVFMQVVQKAGMALRKVAGAVKINYEMHANSGAHLHIHLFPRYLDDDFPSEPIDYRLTEPAPYESYDEYLWFIEQMRKELAHGTKQ